MNTQEQAVLRIFDITFSILGLLFALPVMLLISLLGFLDTGQPMFLQERLGRNQIPFVLFKFRTMVPNTPSVATHLANSCSITRLGYFLRTTKLDELPQLLNVLKGDMSLVGPRPGLQNQFELTDAREQLGVFMARPGLTGLAQVSGINMSTPELLAQTDAKMIAQMSTNNYFKYIFMTLSVYCRGDSIKR